jgi:hypothetical protein
VLAGGAVHKLNLAFGQIVRCLHKIGALCCLNKTNLSRSFNPILLFDRVGQKTTQHWLNLKNFCLKSFNLLLILSLPNLYHELNLLFNAGRFAKGDRKEKNG